MPRRCQNHLSCEYRSRISGGWLWIEGVSVEVEEDRPVALGTLCARMQFLLHLLGREGALQGEWWQGVSNLLLPAASLSRVETNATLADLFGGSEYCSSAADFLGFHSRLLDDYMSALVRFHFVWTAFETIRGECDAGCLFTSTDIGGRTTLARCVSPVQIRLLQRVYEACLPLAQGNKKILDRLNNRHESLVIGRAGHLATGFRNYIFHGDEVPPTPEDQDDWDEAAMEGDESVSSQAYRMECFTRLTLHLLQILTFVEIRRGQEVEVENLLSPSVSRLASSEIMVEDLPFLPFDRDCEFRVPSDFVLNLATCWPEDSRLSLSQRAIKRLATGCDISRKVLALVIEGLSEPAESRTAGR